MGGVNGVALLHWEDENLGVWNPARREFKVLPRARTNKPDNVIERMGIFIGMTLRLLDKLIGLLERMMIGKQLL